MRGIKWMLMALFLFSATVAQAQVAAPRLNPGNFDTFGFINPATLPWEDYSGYGLGTLDGTYNASAPPSANISGWSAGFQWVGENAAFEAATAELETDSGVAKVDSQFNLMEAAFQMGDVFSLGIGLEDSKDVGFGATTEISDRNIGASLVLGEVFYLGVAVGESVFSTTGSADLDTDFNRIGVAYQTERSGSQMHAQIFREARKAADSLLSTEDNSTTGITLEAILGQMLMGFEVYMGEGNFLDQGSVATLERDATIVTLGWVPEEGFSLVLSRFSEEVQNLSAPVNSYNYDITSLGVFYLF